MIVKFNTVQKRQRERACDKWHGLLSINTEYNYNPAQIDSCSSKNGQIVIVSAADIETAFAAFEDFITDRQQAAKRYSCRDYTGRF